MNYVTNIIFRGSGSIGIYSDDKNVLSYAASSYRSEEMEEALLIIDSTMRMKQLSVEAKLDLIVSSISGFNDISVFTEPITPKSITAAAMTDEIENTDVDSFSESTYTITLDDDENVVGLIYIDDDGDVFAREGGDWVEVEDRDERYYGDFRNVTEAAIEIYDMMVADDSTPTSEDFEETFTNV